MRSITYALIYMHSHGVMHRDLKPENLILVSNHADTDLKLIDFGFACQFGPSIPRETRLCGTPGYVAPEMIRGAPYGAEVDMWSVGVIMYVLLAGMPPFASDDAQELFEIIQVCATVDEKVMLSQLTLSLPLSSLGGTPILRSIGGRSLSVRRT
jgi:calcium/calmodulin-dependent protein kinase I